MELSNECTLIVFTSERGIATGFSSKLLYIYKNIDSNFFPQVLTTNVKKVSASTKSHHASCTYPTFNMGGGMENRLLLIPT